MATEKTTLRHNAVWYYRARWIAKIAGLLLCILPTVIVGLIMLPHIVVEKSAESTLSGSFTVCLIAAIYPLYKAMLKLLKSPSAAVIMWLLFALMALCRSMEQQTINALYWVFFAAAIGNTLGAVAFWLSREFESNYAKFANVNILQAKGGVE